MFGMVLEKLLIAELQKIAGDVERKIVAIGVIKLLCECPEMYTGTYQKYWPQLLQVKKNENIISLNFLYSARSLVTIYFLLV